MKKVDRSQNTSYATGRVTRIMSQTAGTVNVSVGFTSAATEGVTKPASCPFAAAALSYTARHSSHPSVRFILKGVQKRRTMAYRRAREIQMELGLIDKPHPTGVSR